PRITGPGSWPSSIFTRRRAWSATPFAGALSSPDSLRRGLHRRPRRSSSARRDDRVTLVSGFTRSSLGDSPCKHAVISRIVCRALRLPYEARKARASREGSHRFSRPVPFSVRSGLPEGGAHELGWDDCRRRSSRSPAEARPPTRTAPRGRPPPPTAARPEREAGECPVRSARANLVAQGRGRQAVRAALDLRRVPLGQRGRDGQHPVPRSKGEGQPPPLDQGRDAEARTGASPQRGPERRGG